MSHKITPFFTYFFKYITKKIYLQGENAWIQIVRKFVAIRVNVEYNEFGIYEKESSRYVRRIEQFNDGNE